MSISRNKKASFCSVLNVNFMHLCYLFMQSSKGWRCYLNEKGTKIPSTYLLYTKGLKRVVNCLTILFRNGIERH